MKSKMKKKLYIFICFMQQVYQSTSIESFNAFSFTWRKKITNSAMLRTWFHSSVNLIVKLNFINCLSTRVAKLKFHCMHLIETNFTVARRDFVTSYIHNVFPMGSKHQKFRWVKKANSLNYAFMMRNIKYHYCFR